MFLSCRRVCLSLALLTTMFSLTSRAQQSAALVGIAKYSRPDDPVHPDQAQLGIQYSTVLIVRDGSEAAVKITMPDIIVPHGKNWWRVGVTIGCHVHPQESSGDEEEQPSNHGHYEAWFEQSYSSPLEKAPEVPSIYDQPGVPCPAQLIDDFRTGKDSRRPSNAPPPGDWELPFQPCIYKSVAITAVTTSFVSTLYHGGNSADCETRGFSWSDGGSVSSLEDLKPVSYGDLLKQKGLEEYKRVLIESGKELESDGMNCGLSEEAFDTSHRWAIDGTGWLLTREKGKWEAVALLQPGNAACQYGGSLSLPLTEELVGHDVLRPEWASLQRQITGLQDAFTSPEGDLIVAVTKSQIEIYSLKGRRVGHRLLALPADRVVMVQWATGKYVGKWAEGLHVWQQKGLPPVVVRKPQD